MLRAPLRCDALPTRRAVLAAAGTLALLPLGRAEAGAAPVPLAALVADGQPSPLARSLAGQAVTVRGYLSPSLDGRAFELTEQPPVPCQLCGATHDAGASLAIRAAQPEAGALPTQEVAATGVLELSPALHLDSARIEAA